MFKKFLCSLLTVVAVCATPAIASEGGYPWDHAPVKITDMAALQNGAKLFINYCLNCHSANSVRYNHLTKIGLTEKQIEENLLFTGSKVGDLMHVAMDPKDAKTWMGATPPDLSVMARAKAENLGQPGEDYIYTYLRTFYRDQTRATGWNNLVFPKVGMPNPLWEMAGPVEVKLTDIHKVADDKGHESWVETVTHVDQDGWSKVVSEKPLPNYKGEGESHAQITYLDKAKQKAYDKNVSDLTAFLGWMGEPDQHFRKVLGTWVMAFLAIFFIVAWFLNKSYWKYVK